MLIECGSRRGMLSSSESADERMHGPTAGVFVECDDTEMTFSRTRPPSPSFRSTSCELYLVRKKANFF